MPLACAFVEEGIRTIGFDTDSSRIADLAAGRPYIGHLDEVVFRRLAASEDFAATTRPQALGDVDGIAICVPTPLDEKHVPDLSPITKAVAETAEHGRPGQLVVLESTTYPGTTRDVLVPALTRADEAGSPLSPARGGSRRLSATAERRRRFRTHLFREYLKLRGSRHLDLDAVSVDPNGLD